MVVADLAAPHVDLVIAVVDLHAPLHVAHAPQPHHAHLVVQLTHLAVHQLSANPVHQLVDLSAHQDVEHAAHKVWIARR